MFTRLTCLAENVQQIRLHISNSSVNSNRSALKSLHIETLYKETL